MSRLSIQIILIALCVNVQLLRGQSHFLFTETNDYQTIILHRLTLRGGPLEIGDEIGVFDGNLCVGARIYENQEWQQVQAWVDDPQTGGAPDGFIAGHEIEFRYWDSSLGQELEIENIEYIEADGYDTSGNFNGGVLTSVNISALLPEHFLFVETEYVNTEIFILNQVLMGLNPLPIGDEIGIFDGDLTVGGVIYTGETDQRAFAWMDDNDTPEQDGFENGHEISFRYFTNNEELGPLTVEYIDGNTSGLFYQGGYTEVNLNVASIPDNLSLVEGWNLISFDVQIENNAPVAVFADLIIENSLEVVTGYEDGYLIYDPEFQEFLNTLTSIEEGMGYWIKVANPSTISTSGSQIPSDFSIQFIAGWNLIGYWLSDSQSPAQAFTAVESNENLEVVTGYEDGYLIYDPEFQPFLNTLVNLNNGFGYWLKTVNQDQEFMYPEPGG